jgi:two-component system, OmpR family, phosphate regulon sensor histidine kinase PhoR
MPPSIRSRIAIPYLVLILLVMAALAMYLMGFVEDSYSANLQEQMTVQARLVGDAVAPRLVDGSRDRGLGEQVAYLGDLLGARVTIIAPGGEVLADSESDPTRMASHLYRPEVQQALAVGQGSAMRLSDTVKMRMMYVAVPLREDGRLLAIVRVALPLSEIERDLASIRYAILLAALVAGVVTLVLAVGIADRMLRPLRRLRQAMDQVMQGDFDTHLVPATRDELGELLLAYNRMAEHLKQTMARLDDERSQLRAVLEHMADGVLIADAEGLVQMLNPSAENILGVESQRALGRSFPQVVREHQIIDVWQAYRETGESQEQLIETTPRGPFVRVVVSPLSGVEVGASLIIVQDLSQIRRLETVRREFVSNISHELRTPLASLRAIADTLRDGALDDPPAAARFLDRMDAEIDALTQMVEELMELSRIESGRVPMRLAPVTVADVVRPAIERLRPQAERVDIVLHVDIGDDMPMVLGDLMRLNQVVTNLLHNAIKFTLPGGLIAVRTEHTADMVTICVEDTGIGIAPDVLPRIFERFYKADRARSEGGTGLGLAIAKHIVQSHGGEIWAESVEGQGSTFCFSLFVAQE